MPTIGLVMAFTRFSEGSHERALEWAKSSPKVKESAVVGAFVKLGNCVDLLDSKYIKQVKSAHELLVEELKILGTELPENSCYCDGISFRRELDCRVIQNLCQINKERIQEKLGLGSTTKEADLHQIQNDPEFIDTVGGMFPEGDELYAGAGFREKNHIQLCVINPNPYWLTLIR